MFIRKGNREELGTLEMSWVTVGVEGRRVESEIIWVVGFIAILDCDGV